jgi:hypothetical protein
LILKSMGLQALPLGRVRACDRAEEVNARLGEPTTKAFPADKTSFRLEKVTLSLRVHHHAACGRRPSRGLKADDRTVPLNTERVSSLDERRAAVVAASVAAMTLQSVLHRTLT